MRVEREHGVERSLDVLDRSSAGREEDRLSETGDMPEQRRVHEVGRGDLERGHVELGEEVGARLVEDGAEEHDAFLPRELAELEPRRGIELERLAVLAVRRPEGVLVVVGRVVQRTRVQRPVLALLKLDRVDPALLRGMDQRLRLLDVSLVVVPDLGDDVDGLVVGDSPTVHVQLGHGRDATARPGRRRSSPSSPPPTRSPPAPSPVPPPPGVRGALNPRADARVRLAEPLDPVGGRATL